MTDSQIENLIAEQKRRYHAAGLPKWQIERLERIPGWSWGEKPATTTTTTMAEEDRDA